MGPDVSSAVLIHLLWALLGGLSLSLACLASFYIRYIWTNRRIIKAARALPTLASKLPFVGMCHHFMGGTEESTRKMLSILHQPGSRVTCMWLGPKPYTVLHRVDDFKTFLTSSKSYEKTDDYKLMKFAFGNGLLVAPGDLWKTTRRFLNPMFHARNISHMEPCINGTARRLVADLKPMVDKATFDIYCHIGQQTSQNIFNLLFAPDHELKMHEKTELLHIVGVAETFGKRFFQPWLWADWIFNILHKEAIKNIQALTRIIDPYLKKGVNTSTRRLLSDHITTSDNTKGSVNPVKVNDIRGVTAHEIFLTLQQLDPKFDEEYRRGETINLIGTGIDTVAVVMSSCLLALGSHPHIQDKVYREVIEVVGEHCNEITIEDTNKLTYLDQVLKETMRVFNTVPYVPRKADRDIQMDGFVIPAGSTVMMSLSSLAMDPKTFPAQDSFDPEHFSAQNMASREKYSFLPFGPGPRDCIGKHYAMMQMKITIAHILKEYRVLSDVNIHKMTFKYALLFVSVDGYKVRLIKRQTGQTNYSK